MKNLSCSLIFYEGPISRCYLNILNKKNIKLENIYYFSTFTIFPKNIHLRYNFSKFNYHPIKILKDKSLKPVFKDILDFFNYDIYFFNEMYEYTNYENYSKNNYFFQTENINDNEIIDTVSKSETNIMINTGKKIYKEIFDSTKKFIHIHPALLPNFKGADASLWSALISDKLGVSSFFMNKKIDEGKLINKKEFELIKLDKFLLKKFDDKTLYRFWFSFIDPLIRGLEFTNIISKLSQGEGLEIMTENSKHNGMYYSFMSKNDINKVFNKVFVKN